jgi:methylase of polypeptide subunit release factors
MKPSLGQLRKKIQPLVFRYWLEKRSLVTTRTRVAGLDLVVFPGVFYPRYFGSSSILASFIEKLDLEDTTLLDMGTGSGVIGLRAARAGARVTSVDVNPSAVACARSNAVSNQIELEVMESDLFASLDGRVFDSVVWNPPFFPKRASSLAEGAFHAGDGFRTVQRFATRPPV